MTTLILLVVFCFTAQQQSELPDYGNISDLVGLRKVYVTSDIVDYREQILKELKNHKALVDVVSSADDADFIIQCVTVDDGTESTSNVDLQELQMTVYTLKNGKKRIAWSKRKASLRPPAKLLTGDFIGALKKAAKEK